MATKIVRPARAGLVVLDPASLRPVPEEGAVVPWNSYWQRRVNEGGLVVVDDSKPKRRTTKATKATKTETDQ